MIKILFSLVLIVNSVTLSAANIVVLGDSISAGYGMNIEQGWVFLLQNKIHSQKFDYTLHNESINGDTTAGGLDRIDFLLARHQPKLLLLELGANDGMQGRPPKTIKTNLAEIVKRSQDAGAKVLLLSMRIPKNTKHGPRYSNMFYNTYLELGKELKTTGGTFYSGRCRIV